MLTWPLIALGWVINLFQRGAASMARLLEILDADAGDRDAGGAASRSRRRRRPVGRVPRRRLPLPAAGRVAEPRWVLRDMSFTRAGRRDARRRRRDGQRQERADRPDRARVRPAGGRDPPRRRPGPRALARRAARARSATCRRRASCSATRSREPRLRHATTDAARPRMGRRGVAQLDETIDETFPAATARCSASAGSTSRAGRSSAPRSRARSRGGRDRAARRRAVRGGHAHRGGDPARAARRARAAHGGDRVAPRQRRARRDVDHRARRGARRGAGHARDADRRGRPLLGAAAAPAARGAIEDETASTPQAGGRRHWNGADGIHIPSHASLWISAPTHAPKHRVTLLEEAQN